MMNRELRREEILATLRNDYHWLKIAFAVYLVCALFPLPFIGVFAGAWLWYIIGGAVASLFELRNYE